MPKKTSPKRTSQSAEEADHPIYIAVVLLALFLLVGYKIPDKNKKNNLVMTRNDTVAEELPMSTIRIGSVSAEAIKLCGIFIEDMKETDAVLMENSKPRSECFKKLSLEKLNALSQSLQEGKAAKEKIVTSCQHAIAFRNGSLRILRGLNTIFQDTRERFAENFNQIAAQANCSEKAFIKTNS